MGGCLSKDAVKTNDSAEVINPAAQMEFAARDEENDKGEAPRRPKGAPRGSRPPN